MKKELVFNVSEVYCAFQQAIENIDMACIDIEGIFTKWLHARMTQILYIPFAPGAIQYRDYPDWLIHKVEKHAHYVEKLIFHWMKFPADIGVVTTIKVEGPDLYLTYQSKE